MGVISMKLIEARDYEEMSQLAAGLIIGEINEFPTMTLGLATGATPVGTYRALIQDYQHNRTSYSRVTTFNLDEYVGLHPTHPNSYHYYMKEKLFDHIDIPSHRIHIPDGMADVLEQECQRYEGSIEESGGIDLQLLGIGSNGHIGFNEPGTPFDKATHVVELTPSTREANRRYFNGLSEVPTHAITMGIGTIMKSKKIILLASGLKKARIVHQLLFGEVDNNVPASILKEHSHVWVIADQEALRYAKS